MTRPRRLRNCGASSATPRTRTSIGSSLASRARSWAPRASAARHPTRPSGTSAHASAITLAPHASQQHGPRDESRARRQPRPDVRPGLMPSDGDAQRQARRQQTHIKTAIKPEARSHDPRPASPPHEWHSRLARFDNREPLAAAMQVLSILSRLRNAGRRSRHIIPRSVYYWSSSSSTSSSESSSSTSLVMLRPSGT